MKCINNMSHTKKEKRMKCAAWLSGLAVFVALTTAVAQEPGEWPNRNVHLIVPYTPGTGADILARILGPKLAERWKVGVITENKAGATGNIGAEFVAKAAPDGYTVLCTATSFATNPALGAKLPFDPVKSFAPIALLATSAVSVVVTPTLPAKTMGEFLDLARRDGDKLFYASPGNGGPQHLAMELLKLETGIKLVHVPYKGSSGALTDVVAGHVHAMIVPLQTAAPFVQSGKLRMLAVMSLVRSPAFPDVPTLKELGIPNLEIETWYGTFAPAGTPASVVAKLNAEINTLLQERGVRELLDKQGMVPAGGTPERFAALVKAELARWSRVVAAAGIQAD